MQFQKENVLAFISFLPRFISVHLVAVFVKSSRLSFPPLMNDFHAVKPTLLFLPLNGLRVVRVGSSRSKEY